MDRLQKVMAHAGIASRRKSEELIKAGKVKVNGNVVTELGTQVAQSDKIEVENVPIESEEPVYFLLNKPRSTISAVTDDKNRKVVTDLFTVIKQRIYPVGRLDYDTTGALILTNDGDFAQLLMHPKNEINKTYVAKVKGLVSKKAIRQLEKGVTIEGKKTATAKVKLLSTDTQKNTSIIELIIHEGRNHQVKKMLESVGYPVQKLTREVYGNVSIKGLNSGEWRELKKHEVNQLRELSKKN